MLSPDLCEGLQMLMRHEGFRGQPYQDTKGNWTIGFGRNLEATPLTEDEATYLLENVVMRLEVGLGFYRWYAKLNPVRKWVCLNMSYHMGLNGFGSFKNMIAVLELLVEVKPGSMEYDTRLSFIKREMLDSKWAREFPERANELADLMVSGVWK